MSENDTSNQSKFDQLIEQIQKSLTEVNASKATATQVVAEVNKAKGETQTALQGTKQSNDQANAILAQAKVHQQEIATLLEQSKTNAAKTAEIARIAAETDKRVKDYETKLDQLRKHYEDTDKKIESLLPGATGAGLAKAFNTRKKDLAPTKLLAIWIFVAAVLGFVGIGIWALWRKDIVGWESFLLFALERSPIIVGLVILEEFSRRLYHSTMRLEEDYAFKETVSTSFDGYQKAMTTVQAGAKDTLAYALSTNVLSALKERPGRLLESEKEDDKIPIQTILAQLQPTGGDEKLSLISKIYDDLKSAMKGSILKVMLIIVVALLVGLFAGRYSANQSREQANPNGVPAMPSTVRDSRVTPAADTPVALQKPTR